MASPPKGYIRRPDDTDPDPFDGTEDGSLFDRIDDDPDYDPDDDDDPDD